MSLQRGSSSLCLFDPGSKRARLGNSQMAIRRSLSLSLSLSPGKIALAREEGGEEPRESADEIVRPNRRNRARRNEGRGGVGGPGGRGLEVRGGSV